MFYQGLKKTNVLTLHSWTRNSESENAFLRLVDAAISENKNATRKSPHARITSPPTSPVPAQRALGGTMACPREH